MRAEHRGHFDDGTPGVQDSARAVRLAPRDIRRRLRHHRRMPSAGRADLFRGASLAIRGASHALLRGRVLRTCWPLFLTSLALTLLLQGGGIALALRLTRGDDARAWWAAAGMVALRFLAILAALGLGAVLGLMLTALVVPLLAERIFMTSLRALSPARADELAALPGLTLRTEIAFGLRRLARFLPRVAGAFLLSFIPLLGIVAGPMTEAYVASRFLSWELLEPWLSRRSVGWSEQLTLLREKRWLLVGFALPFLPALAIPIVGPFLFTIAQAAIALLIVEEWK